MVSSLIRGSAFNMVPPYVLGFIYSLLIWGVTIGNAPLMVLSSLWAVWQLYWHLAGTVLYIEYKCKSNKEVFESLVSADLICPYKP